jgi:hypothetical protein
MTPAPAAVSIVFTSRSIGPDLSELATTPTRRILGMTSFRNCIRLAAVSEPSVATPVTLPPGRARLCTSPASTGSSPVAKTMGTERVAPSAASAAGLAET